MTLRTNAADTAGDARGPVQRRHADDTTPQTGVARIDARRWPLRAAIALKAGVLAVSAGAAVLPLPQLDGKGMEWRLLIVAAAAVVVPTAWRRRFRPYPATADWLLMTPFVLDLIGNLAGWYDSVARFDDVFHFVNWSLLTAAFLAWRFRRVVSPRDGVLLGTGVGAIAIVVWEIAEWAAGELGAAEALGLTYADTISDLALSTLGGFVGSVAAVRIFAGPRRSAECLSQVAACDASERQEDNETTTY